MKSNKGSITFTVVIGYLLLAALAAVALWFIYSQVLSYTRMAESSTFSNRKLYLVGEAATNLYEAESISRELILTGETGDLETYRAEIDTIRTTLDSLKSTYTDAVLRQEIDSISVLLSRKVDNLEELLELRQQQGSQSYYSRVINELQRVDESFGTPPYEERFRNLQPHQRRVLIKLLEYSERDNARQITTQTLDSLVNSVKNVLSELEYADRQYRTSLRRKEDELLANEVRLNSQLRNLLSTIESEEREASLAQVSERQEIISSTSITIALLGAASFLVILVFLFLVFRDVTRSQRYRQELENAKQYAESLLKSREQFMATVTHDLRSPLNTVVGYTELLEKSRLNRTQHHYLNHLKKASDFTLHLVNDLLDLSRLEAGKMTVEELSFNPKDLIEDTVENAIPAQRSEDVSVHINISEALDRPVKSDPFRIKQIITNLVTNACKFTEKGSITVEAHLDEAKKKKTLVLIVRDTGIGISEEKKEAIFEEFSQENSSIEKKFGGSGLGLAISKKITELLGGEIELKSEQGKGSEFTVHIPVRLSKQSIVKAEKQELDLSRPPAEFSVLIVDDEPAQQSLLKELIKSSGMKAQTANNGKEALEKLDEEKFDLILTDIQMPQMDGFELLSRLKASSETREIPVIALSGKPDTNNRQYLELGFSGSLLKPYTSGNLLELIEEVLQTQIRKNSVKSTENNSTSGNYSLEEVSLFAGGDRKALELILNAFIESSRKNLEALKEEHKKGKEEKVAGIAHKMLPMFRQLKVTKVTAQLEQLESPVKERYESVNVNCLSRDIEDLLKELEQETTG